MPRIKILIVDDSVVVRRLLSNVLDGDAALEVVGTAPNGKIALAKISQVHPDLIVLDVEMPEMDGLETLAAIRKLDGDIPVIMFSALTELGAVATLNALALGATDYVTKPHNMKSKEAALEQVRDQLIPKIKAFCKGGNRENLGKIFLAENERVASRKLLIKSGLLSSNLAANIKAKVEIVAVGTSTGGPNALETILQALPANFPVPIVIVQHMPPVFTKRLADRLAEKCKMRVEEAVTGSIVEPGVAWIAPGDYHMVLEKQGFAARIRTNQEARENSCRPSVDVLFRSTAKIYGAGVLGVVLTGMGQDGLHGCQNIRDAGGKIIVQDELSSVVWGMPGSVANSGFADRVVSLQDMAREIIDRVSSY
ncbi:chemotaxis response regulator protein-glutamate methylesterase [Tychonema sp. LEGE 07203]|uniref:protein-glutamate methylesterase/protein-glutamine glutaminase n=1 Tax=Tychonema sp. LEGE 07203 TaxID=1828671 RepID=UPI001882A31A|nr:chemotaxis response regulator protein-glutamate methylesterase [Tychonema sp. LEGE 07203]MBE9096287.1 chemotaxis response regulator protein-glutamate methylesterase [Tychonema sp. LEGE 07203]